MNVCACMYKTNKYEFLTLTFIEKYALEYQATDSKTLFINCEKNEIPILVAHSTSVTGASLAENASNVS